MPHPANSPFTVEVADAHPQVDVSRRRSRSNAVLHTTMLFRSSSTSVARVTAEGAERVRIAITGSEATAFGNPTFGERTSITITHRDVNHAMRTSLYSRDPRQPVRFVTVAPIPEAEVLPPPTTPGIDLPLLEAKTINKESAEYDLLVPPDEAEVMEQWAEEVARQRISDQVKELLEEKEASKLQTPLTIDTSSSESPFPCISASPTLSEFPERPSAPGPLSPYSDDDEDFPLGIRRGSTLTSFKSFGESSVASEDVPPPQLAVSSVVLDRSKNGSSSSLPQTASPVVSLTKMLKLKLASPKSRSTSDLTALGYNDGVPLTRGRSGNISSLKQRFPVVKRLFGLGKGKAVDRSKDKNGRRVTPVPTAASIAVVKPVGQKRQRDDDEADENAPPNEEKERRIIRRRLVA